MKGYFSKTLSHARILDFTDGFKEKTLPIEIRTDRFTGRVSRILRFRMKLPAPSHDRTLIEKAKDTCPFCPERIETNTPRFPPDIVPEGRIRCGEATVIPNAFPYCTYCGVTIFARRHYIPLGALSAGILSDAVDASMALFHRIRRFDTDARYFSINWNYMPTAGGSLFHPHFQVVATHRPTTFHGRLMRRSEKYIRTNGRSYWEELIAFEKAEKVRYLFDEKNVAFLASYSPGGIFSEVLALFRHVDTLDGFDDAVRKNFITGLVKILQCFHRRHLDNLNMTLFMGRHAAPGFAVQARIMPRIVIPPWGTSDVNYFEKGHDEKVVVFSPEDLARAIRQTAVSRASGGVNDER